MFSAKTDPTGSSSFEVISFEDIKSFIEFIWNKANTKRKYLNTSRAWLLEYYSNEAIKLLESSDGRTTAPYEIIHDYRKNPIADWGTCILKGDYRFPNKLSRVKEIMVDQFTKAGKLSKRSGVCPRVADVSNQDGRLTLDIEKAFYYDQVATNLTLDYEHLSDIAENLGASTVRDWDIKQSRTKKGSLPSFSKSRLANTIGVSVAITTTNKYGQKMLVIRKRSSTVAVFENKLTLPLSFALNFEPENMEVERPESILNLIKPDFKHEQAQELGLEPTELNFSDVKPLLFCRELCRGGKPQFLLEIEIKTPFEELASRISESTTSSREYTSKLIGSTLDDAKGKLKQEISHDLLAYIVAKS